jgi:hypothetical protein
MVGGFAGAQPTASQIGLSSPRRSDPELDSTAKEQEIS